jgi:hypothetical protein
MLQKPTILEIGKSFNFFMITKKNTKKIMLVKAREAVVDD